MPCASVFPKILIGIACFVAMTAGLAQQHSPMAFDHLTAEDGLSHSTVYTILQDKNGLIWFGTRYGLNRYDGYECKVFLPIEGEEGSLGGPTVLALMEDHEGKIWAGHREAGISIWDENKGGFQHFPTGKTAGFDWSKATVRAIFEDSRHWVWVGTIGGGVFVFDEKRRPIHHLCATCDGKQLSSDFVFDFAEDADGTIWIATDGRGLNAFHPATQTTSTINSTDSLNMRSYEKSLCLDQKGNLWVGTAGSGLYQYDLRTKQFTHFLHQKNNPEGLSYNFITDLALDPSGKLYIATDGGGLNLLDPENGHFKQFTAAPDFPQSLNTNALYHLLFDRTGNLWVGSFNGGVNIHKAFSPPFFIHENQNEYRRKGLGSVLALREDEAGKIWMGTDGGGLFFAEGSEKGLALQAATAAGKRVPNRVVTCLVTAPNGGLWFGSFQDGLSFFDTKAGTIRNFRNQPGNPKSLSHNNVWDIERDASGGLWIGTLGGGLNYLPPGGDAFRRFQPVPGDSNSISSVQIVDVLLDKNGEHLWVAFEDKGLNRIDIADPAGVNGGIKRYATTAQNAKNRLNCDNIQCLFQDGQGRLWIGTEFKGLDCILPNDGGILHFDVRDGLPSNMVFSIEMDGDGFLWVSTQKGIARLDVAKRSFIDFGTDDNQRNSQYNPRSVLRLRDGRLVFGGTNGFSMLSPNGIKLNMQPPATVFTGLRISGQEVPIGDWNGREVLNGDLNGDDTVVRLAYSDRGIVFEFTGTDFTSPSKNKFAYRLEGFEEQWNYVGAAQHRAVYSNLKGGSYTLKVMASNSDNIWGEASSLRIVVAPPFWQTWWFALLCLCVAAAVIYLVIKYLLEHQKSVYQEKSFKAEQEIMRLKNERLENEVEAKQSKLSASVMQSAHKNQFLADLKAQIQKLEGQSTELRKVIRAIDGELNQADYWEQFQISFNQTHQAFVQKLQQQHPDITNNDIRLSCFVRMGLSNAEIASILNVTVNGVEQSKYRLKRKMGLEKEASLNEYVKGL